MKKLVVAFLFLSLVQSVISQNSAKLNDYFSAYEIQSFDLASIYQNLNQRNSFKKVNMTLPEVGAVTLELTPRDLFSDQLSIRVATHNGIEVQTEPSAYPYYGTVKGYNDSKVSFTIAENYLNGYIKIGQTEFNFQQLSRFLTDADTNDIIIYKAEDAILSHPANCGADHLKQNIKAQGAQHIKRNKADGECFEVEIALASDFEMFEAYGSANNVEDQMVGVLNDVQTNYDDEFPDEILFEISEFYIATSEGTDPWINDTNAGDLLDDFRDWGQSGGFGGGYDVATLWTDRNLDGGTVGIAWLSALCSSFRYNVCEDFSTTAWRLRVLQAHELGHNFGSSHDGSGSGFIMAPSVNNSNTWSTQSINSIEDEYLSAGCLSDCPGGGGGSAPTADFSYDQNDDCSVVSIEFFDESSGTVDDYFWEFEGGNPSTSTQQNPTVTYVDGGVFDVQLTVSNNFGDDELELNNEIIILDGTEADFTFDVQAPGNIVEFTNLSNNDVIDWFWDFDDGGTSQDINPTYVFEEDGEYYVELEVFNGECEDVVGEWIFIETPPTAAFTSNIQSGCAPLTVDFFNESSDNADDYYWEFEGGNPEFSNETSPVVVYETAGVFSVLLIAENDAGSDQVVEEMYITVEPQPNVDFSSIVDGFTVSFLNTSSNYNSSSWDFGDGNFSDLDDPMHTYDNDGTYVVSLTIQGDCGTATYSQEIEISSSANAVINQDIDSGCLPFVVTYDGTGSNLADSYLWTFEGGNPSSSTDPIVEVTYDQIGVYDVSLFVSNSFSDDVQVLSEAVVVNDVPSADFSANQNGNSFVFEATGNDTYNTTYDWDFGDGIFAFGTVSSHAYPQEGVYQVQLTATNECGTSSSIQEFNLFTQPVADFTADVREGCVPMEVQYTSESSPNVESFLWTFEGGTPASSTEENPVVTYLTKGLYSVSLIVENPAGTNEFVQDNYIQVKDIPIVFFTTNHDQTTLSFENNSTDATSYEWDFGDGSNSFDITPVHEYASEGTYIVTLIATNDCGSATYQETVEVTLKPTADFSFDSNEGCAPLTVQFSDNSSSNVEGWSWEFEGGVPAVSNEQNPTITYNNPGIYSVKLEVTGEGGVDLVELDDVVVVLGLPQTEILSQINGNTVEFDSQNGDLITYDWDFGDGNTANIKNPMHSFAANGTYLVTLTITDECGTSSITTEVTINAYAVANFSADDSIGCPPFEVTFTQETMNGETFMWNFPGGSPETSESESVTVVYDQAGSYSVRLQVGNELGVDGIEIESFITVGELPIADFNISVDDAGLSMIQNNSSNGDTYSWDFGDGTTSTDQMPLHSYTESGTYLVELTVMNDCGEETTTREITVEVDREPLINILEIRPNPNLGEFWLYVEMQGRDQYNYTIMDMTDRLIASGTLDLSSQINIYAFDNIHQQLTAGTYIVRLENDANTFTERLIIQE